MIKNQQYFEQSERNQALKKVFQEIDQYRRTGKYPDVNASSKSKKKKNGDNKR